MELKLMNREELTALYQNEMTADFPKAELKPLSAMLRLLDMGRYDPLLITEGGQSLGYALLWLPEGREGALLEYLGVLRGKRNGGLGTRILALLGTRYGQLFGEAEAPDPEAPPEENNLRRRRIAFYERNGFRVLDYQCALFGVRFHCLYRGPEADDRKVEALHRSVYAGYFSPAHMERYIQLPLAPGEEVRPAPEWVEEQDDMELLVKRFDQLTLTELYQILELRVSVFVVEQQCPYPEVDGRDPQAYHVFLRDRDGIQAYLRVLPPGAAFPAAAIGRVIAVKRRCGLGSRVLAAGIDTAREKFHADSIQLEAQTYARGLYEKAGFRQVSEEFLEDGIPHIRMALELPRAGAAEFCEDSFLGRLTRGDLRGAMDYLRQFPDQAGRYQKYAARFEAAGRGTSGEGPLFRRLLEVYHSYYRDVFYLQLEPGQAEEAMRRSFIGLLGVQDVEASLDALEAGPIAQAFQAQGFQFLGGRTRGCYGPYVWAHTDSAVYDVELPGGTTQYTVNLLDGFLSKGWLDYLSFGAAGTGGWCNGDGPIHCVRDSYDLDSEAFRVSLLKHEAQHAADLAVWPGMSPEDLEYRAKLVELIYSEQRNLLKKFSDQAGSQNPSDGHARAAARIMEEMAQRLGAAPQDAPFAEVQAAARALFQSSCGEMVRKYGENGGVTA